MLGRDTARDGTPAARGGPGPSLALYVPAKSPEIQQLAPGGVERFPEHAPEGARGAFPDYDKLLASNLEIDPQSELIPSNMMTMRDVDGDVAGENPGTERVEFRGPRADFGVNPRRRRHAGKGNDDWMPHQ